MRAGSWGLGGGLLATALAAEAVQQAMVCGARQTCCTGGLTRCCTSRPQPPVFKASSHPGTPAGIYPFTPNPPTHTNTRHHCPSHHCVQHLQQTMAAIPGLQEVQKTIIGQAQDTESLLVGALLRNRVV